MAEHIPLFFYPKFENEVYRITSIIQPDLPDLVVELDNGIRVRLPPGTLRRAIRLIGDKTPWSSQDLVGMVLKRQAAPTEPGYYYRPEVKLEVNHG